MDPTTLIEHARTAAEQAIAPYSDYQVGAAIKTSQDTYGGANIEIANYSNSLHAEEVALARALYAGEREFEAIAIATLDRDGAPPCGACRQTLREFCEPELSVYLDRGDEYIEYTLGELLPASFTLDT